MEKNKVSYEQLEAENKRLKTRLDTIEKSRQRFFSRSYSILSFFILGNGLKTAIKEAILEFNQQKHLSVDTISNLGAHIIRRLTRIGVVAFLIAITPSCLLYCQNNLLENQNRLIVNQNTRIEQQTYLQEAGRRSSLIFLMNNVLDKMDEELKSPVNKDRNLSDQLIGRIVALSKSLKPYKYLESDSLSMTVSPERGQ
jgi:hypothetical protein